jgi:SAM-dependent methyltransferase
MVDLPENITTLSSRHGFDRSAKYDQAWMFDNAMGPNPLWLVEWLCRGMRLSADMIVLDMGCGKALTSIFLAKEFGCTVFANDLWIPAEENLARIAGESLERKVYPIHAEAHALPYSRGFFDAVVCVDSYQYYGTDDFYLDYFVKLVRPGGRIGIVVPGWLRETGGRLPPGLEVFPRQNFGGFKTSGWWRDHLEASEQVVVETCDYLENGKRVWLDSAGALYEAKRILRVSDGTSAAEAQKELDFWKGDIDFLEADVDDYVTLVRIIVKREGPGV